MALPGAGRASGGSGGTGYRWMSLGGDGDPGQRCPLEAIGWGGAGPPAWRCGSVTRLEAAPRGEPPVSPWPEFPDPDADVKAVNAIIVAASRNRSLAEVLADSRERFARMEPALQALPEDALAEPDLSPWLGSRPLATVVEGMVEHWAVDHAPDLRRLAAPGSHADKARERQG